MQVCAPVQVLYASVGHLDSFGRALGIKHLILQAAKIRCERLSPTLSVLQQLQTLELENYEQPLAQTSGALHLTALPDLWSVALCKIVPESITLNKSCELHVKQCTQWGVEHSVWDTVAPLLRSVSVSPSNPDVMSALPSILLRAGNLVKASVKVDCIGTAAAPLQLNGALAHVKELVVHCLDLYAIVPARVAWRNVFLSAENVLDLRLKLFCFHTDCPGLLLPLPQSAGMLSLALLGLCS